MNLSILTQFHKQAEHHFDSMVMLLLCASYYEQENARIFVNFGHKFSFPRCIFCVSVCMYVCVRVLFCFAGV